MKDAIEKEEAILSELIHINRDGYLGFREAAKDVRNKDLQELLRKEAFQRFDFGLSLLNEARKKSLQMKARDSIFGKLHRSWMKIVHRFKPRRDFLMLSECLRGDEHALKVYQDVFEAELLCDLQPILERQFVNIIQMRDMLRKECYPKENRPECGSVLHLSN